MSANESATHFFTNEREQKWSGSSRVKIMSGALCFVDANKKRIAEKDTARLLKDSNKKNYLAERPLLKK